MGSGGGNGERMVGAVKLPIILDKQGTEKTEECFFSTLDREFGKLLETLCKGRFPVIFRTGMLVSALTRSGHVCLDLNDYSGRPAEADDTLIMDRYPNLTDWMALLKQCPVVGAPGEFCPLILDDAGRLYLYRYWKYEQQLAEKIRLLAETEAPKIDIELFRLGLSRLFTDLDENAEPDWQKTACAVANLKRFCVISGGPGTGKTSTVIKILALMLEQHRALPNANPLRIVMAAPTGKAAARLTEAVNRAKEALSCEAEIKDLIPSEAATVHRVLRPIAGTPYFRHDADHPLPADVVVVDEASMVDLALMAKLAASISRTGRLILLGDKDQLASVEAGAVLGNICGTHIPNRFSMEMTRQLNALMDGSLVHHMDAVSSLGDCRVQLKKSYRFSDTGMIAALSQAVNKGDNPEVIRMLSEPWDTSVRYEPGVSGKAFTENLRHRILSGYAEIFQELDPAKALEKISRFKILCAVNFGPFGVSGINRFAEKALYDAGYIQWNRDRSEEKRGGAWYRGRPVMILRNDYRLQLFNGDVGITMPDPQDPKGPLWIFFQSNDGGIRKLLPEQLPDHQTVFALTVHKSQGSEFANILFILPDRAYPVLTRELIYTAITRAVHHVEIWADPVVLATGIQACIQRNSGLRDALWK
jgi:exodeoxyribonuclease V alpha subunit